ARMALLYGLLWRLLLVLVHVNRALISWLRVRLRSWKGRLWERAMAALLLPLALAGLSDHQKKLNPNPDGNANPVIENRTASRRFRWQSDGRSLEKMPVHIGLLVAEEEPSYNVTDIANLVVWCMAVGISYVSVYDNHGIFQKNNSRLLKEIVRQQQDLLGLDGSKYNVEFVCNGSEKHQHHVVSCRPTVKVLSPEDGKQSIVQAAQQLCRSVENKEKTSKDISVSMLDMLIRESKNIPDPELVVKFGPVDSTLGFLPWHIRLTEFISLPSHRNVSYEDLLDALRRYGACQQRLEKGVSAALRTAAVCKRETWRVCCSLLLLRSSSEPECADLGSVGGRMISVVSTVESVPRGTETSAPSVYQRIRKVLTRCQHYNHAAAFLRMVVQGSCMFKRVRGGIPAPYGTGAVPGHGVSVPAMASEAQHGLKDTLQLLQVHHREYPDWLHHRLVQQLHLPSTIRLYRGCSGEILFGGRGGKVALLINNDPLSMSHVLCRDLLVTLALGQVLSLLICAIGLTSKYLADDFHANTPVFQSFLNYILLFLVYTTTLAVRQGEGNLLAILKQRWWKYMILGLIDIEANFLVLKAYQYTSLSSVQLLDCFVIPVVLLLSWFFLLVRYKAVHYVGAGLCLLGIGCMVGADILLGQHQGLVSQFLPAEKHPHSMMLPPPCRDGIGLVMSGAWFPANMTPSINAKEFNLCLIRPENFVSHGLRESFRCILANSKMHQAGCHVPSTQEWLLLFWPLYHTGLIGGLLQRWLSFWKVLLSLQSLDGRPALGRVLVVPNFFFHLRMMEATVHIGTFKAADIFLYPSPDLCLETILSLRSTDNSFDFMLGEQKLFGDLLVLGGATLYGISNVCEEFIVKNLSRVEFLGMMGLFGSFFSGIQLAIMEHKELLKVPWDWQIGEHAHAQILTYNLYSYTQLILPQNAIYSAFMFSLYSFMPVVMKRTSATSVNLSLLTADLYSLFCGLLLFHYKFSGLYLLSFFLIILGLVLYSSTSTYVAQDPRVYKQFRNTGSQPATDQPPLSPGVLEPSVTYTNLCPETGDELP
ncbi:hypothetical protein L3Q82_010784, partial [Scortum barcoo]